MHFTNKVIFFLNFEDFILQNVFFLYIFCSYFVFILNSVVKENVIYSLLFKPGTAIPIVAKPLEIMQVLGS